MNYILNELRNCESRKKKRNNADQVGIMRTPLREYMLRGFADLIKGSPDVRMEQDYADRTSKYITMSASWDTTNEIKATIIVTL